MSFVVSFPTGSCIIPMEAFQQSSPTHWILDVGAYLSSTQQQKQLPKEIFLSLAQPHCLPSPDIALALYSITVSSGGNDTNWSYRGYVSNDRPSDVMPVFVDGLDMQQQAAAYQIHVVVESMEEVSSKHLERLAGKEDFCRRVGMDLFQYMQSFSQSSGNNDYITVPMNILDTWFNRISSKLRHDPDFLTRKKEII